MTGDRMSGPELRVAVRTQSPGVVEIAVAGELDLSTVPQLPPVFAEALAGRPRLVELDLDGVPFMDSSGINLLVRTRRQASAAGSELVITRIQPTVHRVLSIFGLADVLCPDIEAPPDPFEGDGAF
jgi:anti-anti-sigma factor